MKRRRSRKNTPAGLIPGLCLAAALAALWFLLENSLAFAVVADVHVLFLRTGFLFILFLWILLLMVMTGSRSAELARTESLLHERDQLAARLARNMEEVHVGEWEWRPASGRISWSEETFRLFGVREAMFEPSLERFQSFFHPEDGSRFKKHLEQALRNGTDFRTTGRVYRPNGIQRTMEISGRRRIGPDGEPVSIAGLVRDITETVRMRTEVREHRNRLRAFADGCPASLIVLDDRGRVDAINPATEKLLGMFPEDIVGKPADAYFVFEHEEKEATALELLNSPGGSAFSRPRVTVLIHRKNSRRRHVALQARRFGDGDNKRILLSIRTLSDE